MIPTYNKSSVIADVARKTKKTFSDAKPIPSSAAPAVAIANSMTLTDAHDMCYNKIMPPRIFHGQSPESKLSLRPLFPKRALAVLALSAVLLTGCAKQPYEPNNPNTPAMPVAPTPSADVPPPVEGPTAPQNETLPTEDDSTLHMNAMDALDLEKFEEATAIAESIQDPFLKQETFRMIDEAKSAAAEKYARASNHRKAEEIADSITDPYIKQLTEDIIAAIARLLTL